MSKKTALEKALPTLSDEFDDEAPRHSIYDLCETDTEAEENGRWFKDLFDDGNNINVKLRRMSSKASIAVRRRLEKQFKSHQKRDGTFPDDVGTKMIVLQLAHAIIVDWENIIDRTGEDIPFSPEHAITLLTRLPTFRDTLIAFSLEMDNFRVEDVEDAVKN